MLAASMALVTKRSARTSAAAMKQLRLTRIRPIIGHNSPMAPRAGNHNQLAGPGR